MSTVSFVIGQQKIGAGRCFVIGEVAQSHDGSLGMAHAYIDAIAKAGADAVKFQTHIADAESSPEEPWRVKFSRQDATRFDYWKRMEFTKAQWVGLLEHAEEKGLVFLSSPFSMRAAEMLGDMGMSAWKVASGEVNNIHMLRWMAETGKPILLSSGMSPLSELDKAINVAQQMGVPVAVMQCTSSYPTPPERIGLNLLQEYRNRYACPVGLSDHSGDIYAGLAAVTLGADLLEVHVTMSRDMFGPDVVASVTTEELTKLVQGARFIESAQQNPVDKNSLSKEFGELRAIFMKSLFLNQDLEAGEEIQERHLIAKKPGTGISAESMAEVIGKRMKVDRIKGWMLHRDDLT